MTFAFKAQLRAGQIGEVLFEHANKDNLLKLDGFQSDFIFKPTGEGLELKTDYYSMDKTPNFFFERYSDKAKQSPGGPWQAKEHGSGLFVYFFVPSLTYFTFNTDQLIGRLEVLLPELDPWDVQNKSHTTVGYRVAREGVADIAKVTVLELKPKEPANE